MAPARRVFASIGIPLLVTLAVLAPARPAGAWTWLPDSRDVPTPYADPREPRLGFEIVDGGAWSARVGRTVEVARSGRDLELGLDGSVWLWFSSLPRFNFPLETVDGTFGFWAGGRGERVSWRLRLAHWSGHIGDGASDIEARRIVYSRESLTALAFVDAGPHLRLHGGPALFVRADPATQAFQCQLGGEWRPGGAPFVAVDFRAKAENVMRVNQSYRAGLRFAGLDRHGAFRVQLGYDIGHSERGQEYRTPERFVSLGCSFSD